MYCIPPRQMGTMASWYSIRFVSESSLMLPLEARDKLLTYCACQANSAFQSPTLGGC